MSEEYSKITAQHYAAFRPSLHAPILQKCLGEDRHFDKGLDVGCGTGRSTIALGNYCNSVVGIDPSTAMLEKASPHPKITYIHGVLEEAHLDTDAFDIITFAGVLFYCKSPKLYQEVVRLGRPGALIIAYDFEVLLKAFDALLDLGESKSNSAPYDHEINFSGLLDEHMETKAVAKEAVTLSVSPKDLTHLILAEEPVYGKLASRFGAEQVFERVQGILKTASKGSDLNVQARIYYSIYENKT